MKNFTLSGWIILLSMIMISSASGAVENIRIGSVPPNQESIKGKFATQNDVDRYQFITNLRENKIIPGMKKSQEYIDDYQKLIAGLIELLNDKTVTQQAKYVATSLLGHLRAAEATQNLVDNILLRGKKLRRKYNTIDYETYPAAAALSEIGSPAIPFILKKIASEENEETLTLCAGILKNIEGKEIAEAVVKSYFTCEKNIKYPGNLEKILQLLSL